MTAEIDSKLRDMLYRALAEPIGQVLATSEPKRLRQRFYQVRAASKDPELARLQIRLAPAGLRLDDDSALREGEVALVICKGTPAGSPG